MAVVAFQGERGAFSEEAAAAIYPDAEMLPLPSFADVFAAVADGRAEYGVPAVENSTAGSINETYDLLVAHQGRIFPRGEYELHVQQCLMALPGQSLADIHTVQSHWQALAQVSRVPRGAGREDRAGLRHGGEREAGPRGEPRGVLRAIASGRAAAIYGLELLAEAIQTNKDNYTRFLVLGQGGGSPGTEHQDQPGVRGTGSPRLAVQGHGRVRDTRGQRDQAGVAPDPRPPLGVPLLRGRRGSPSRYGCGGGVAGPGPLHRDAPGARFVPQADPGYVAAYKLAK